MGWPLLLNENRTIARGNDQITIAGMENDGDGKRSPRKGDITKTLDGVADGAFIVMVEHDPSAWRRKIIPDHRAQLTLSGHTHAGQIKLFSFRSSDGAPCHSPVKRSTAGTRKDGSRSL